MPDDPPIDIRNGGDHLLFKVFVLPKSSKNAVAGIHLDALKVKLTAPPVEGKANKMCIEFLSKTLKVPKSSLSIVSGQTRRTKRIRFDPPAAGSAKTEIHRMQTMLAAWAGFKKGA